MNYTEMTDLEINKSVAGFIYPGKEFTAAYSFGFPLGPQVQWIQGYGEFLRKDYCNSWADAGSIITANKISVMYDENTWAAFSGMSIHHSRYADWDLLEYDKNPLRAAMIVFLMMNESKRAGGF